MIKFLKQHKPFILLSIIIITGAFLRFYKLDWGNGLFTHPDEYHIAASVNQLSFPNQMHPHFFSYGTVTIYLIYFTKEIIEYFNSFLIGRFYSALFSTLTILIVYKICLSFMERRFSYLAALLTALTPGLIQQAHFATPESALTFFLFASLLFMIKFLKQNNILFLLLASVFLGLALGVKISSIVFLLPLILSIILGAYLKNYSVVIARSSVLQNDEAIPTDRLPHQSSDWFAMTGRFIILILVNLFITFSTFALVAPFVFLDFPAFRSNLGYEGGLAIRKIPVFYTRQFIDTMPVLFQVEKILPYALGPILLVLSILGLAFLAVSSRQDGYHMVTRQARTINIKSIHVLIIVAFFSLLLPNAFLFAKWTRFIAPTFPFFAIFAAFLLQKLGKKTASFPSVMLERSDSIPFKDSIVPTSRDSRMTTITLAATLLITTSLWTMAFLSIYKNRDIRIIASNWIESHALPGSSFLVEGGNMIDLPLKGNFPRISLDLYTLEDNPLTREKIIDALYSSDYFIVQSRRVFYNHQRLSHLYPKTSRFYDVLFNGQMGFEQIKEFHSYPTLEIGNWKLEIPDESAEETWSVFDHPVIRVFKKNKQLLRQDYEKFFEI